MDAPEIEKIEQVVGHKFSDLDLLEQALTHASLADSRLQSNERLEFLGDAVLGMVVCSFLYERYEDLLEGELTKIKSTVVSRRVCAEVAESLGLEELMLLGKGLTHHASLPSSVIAAVFESLIGALYIDGGVDAAREFILKSMKPKIEESARSGHQHNFKSVLQQMSQQHLGQTPLYVVLDEKGPDHAKCFEVAVEIGARRFQSCWGPSKKQAEQDAALQALEELEYASRDNDGLVHIRHAGKNEKTTSATTDSAV